MRLTVATRAFTGMLAMTTMMALSTSLVQGADKVLAENRLPSGVLLYVSSPDIVTTCEKFQKTGVGKLFRDPSLDKFREQIVKLYEEFRTEAEEKSGVKFSDVASVFNGEFSVAVVRPVGQPLGWAAFLEYGDKKSAIDALLKRSRDQAGKEEKVTIETEEIDGVQVTTYTVSQDEEGATPVTVSLMQKDGQLVAASGISILESILERWDGKDEDVFGKNKIYREIYSKCVTANEAAPGVVYFVDPIGLLASGLSMSPQTQNFAGMIYMPTLGLSGLKGIGGAHHFATKDFDSIGRSMVYVEGAPTGIVKIFQLRSQALNVPTWVPHDASQYISFDWDIKGAYEAIESIYDSFLGPGRFAMATANLLQQAGVDLKLKADVIDVLDGKFSGYFNTNPGASDPSESFTGLLSIGVNDPVKGKKLVDAVWKLAGGAKSSEFEGNTLFEPEAEGAPGAVALNGNSIFVSNKVDIVKVALSPRPASPLTNTDEYKAAVKFAPANVSLFSYQNSATQLEDAYEKARGGELDGLAEGKLDFSVLPPFEKLTKYLAPTVGYYVPDENGCIAVQYVLKTKE